ncbi:hypothetical protein H9L06_00220 [Leucobacter denitrificans]|uniref:Uncharacterized protein n=2 Tax=Leucobacter denitrificans TaxID=683042 RepID=A0A7G9S7G5_9MICO|nr:hypothetical protein H9L06_00220 [Leucobacter denitrificans]
MSRATRTGRGMLFAAIATVLAAASHALAGGTVTPIAMLVTAIIALPLCVALAGRSGSVWRVAIAVGVSQFFYHWVFAGIGASTSTASGPIGDFPAGSHAAHLAALEQFVPRVIEAGAADATMWILHGLAAIISAAFIARGERAIMALGSMLGRAFPHAIAPTEILAPVPQIVSIDAPALRVQLLTRCARTLRGPPVSY